MTAVKDPVAGVTRGRVGTRALVRRLASGNLLWPAVIILIIFFSIRLPRFAQPATVIDVLNQSVLVAIVVAPSALLLISGYVDLSVGSVLAVSAAAGALTLASTQSVLWGLLVCCAVGALLGAINGGLIARIGLSPIIVTLAMLTAGRGVAQVIFNFAGQNVGSPPASIADFGTAAVLGVPYLVIIAALVLAIAGFLLRYLAVGRHLYAIGVNQRAAYLSGIRVSRIVMYLYLATGLATGLAAFVYIARYSSVQPGVLGVGFEIQVLTAALLGGVAFDGGKGNIAGATAGILFLGVLTTGLQQMAALPSTQLIVQGAALAVAAGLQWATGRRKH